MGALLGAGCLLIAYGPSAILLLFYAARRSALLVLTIARYARRRGDRLHNGSGFRNDGWTH